MRRRFPLALGLVTTVSLAIAASLSSLLGALAANARFPAPTRADVRIVYRQDDKETRGTAVLLGKGHTLYVETRTGTRALIRPSKIVVRTGTKAVRAEPGARLDDTGMLLEDFVPVTPSMLKVPQVSDEGPTGTVITGAPAFPSVRALIVLTADPETAVVTRVKYFEKSISDLASFRRDEEIVDVDGHRRPTRITVDRRNDGSSTRLELAWRAAPGTPPAVFTPRGLRGPSPVVW